MQRNITVGPYDPDIDKQTETSCDLVEGENIFYHPLRDGGLCYYINYAPDYFMVTIELRDTKTNEALNSMKIFRDDVEFFRDLFNKILCT